MHNTDGSTKCSINSWRKSDITWMLCLYGTAIGAGVLFLPINAGAGGLVPLIVMTIFAFPMTFYSHRALMRFVLSGTNPNGNITDVVEEHFGIKFGRIITILYFFTVYPILLIYSVAITNTVDSLIVNQLGLDSPPRCILSLILISIMMTVVCFGEQIIVKAMSFLVFPFVCALLLIAYYLIPYWDIDTINNFLVVNHENSPWITLWIAMPVMIFSFNHSPIISSFTVVKRKEYGINTDKKCSSILGSAHIMMVVTVMFFVFSCVLSLSPIDLQLAKKQNISILSYIANHFNIPIIAWMGPIISIIAITKSFLGHYLGAREGFNSIATKFVYSIGKKNIKSKHMNYFTTLFMLLTTWFVATLNPSILGIIESIGGPIIAIMLFLMPMYAIKKVPSMRQYSGSISNVFVVCIGLLAISSIFYSLVIL